MKKWTAFVSGLLVGTAGFKILGSSDAKKVYAHTTAAVIRAKDCVVAAVTNIKENADDVLAEAKDINEKRAEKAEAEVIEDSAEKAE
jgi:hypothetical protein